MPKQALSLGSSDQSNLLNTLLNRGDKVMIEQGVLKITPHSGKAVPMKWYKANEQQLVKELCRRTGTRGYRFESFTTGRYSVKGSTKKGGITLLFSDVVTGTAVSMLFNADLTRTRNTVAGNKGSSLLGKKFTVSKRSGFYGFWISAGLKLPPSLSKFHDYMGNLKPLVFTGELQKVSTANKDGMDKIINKTTRLLSLSCPDVTQGDYHYLSHGKAVSEQPSEEWLRDWNRA